MKNKIIFTTFLVVMISCIKDYETTTKFTIENSSGRKIVLKVFNANFQIGVNLDSTIQILDTQSFSFSYTYKGKDNSYMHPFGKTADSVFVIYDDTLKIKLIKDDTSFRNILNIESYEGGRKSSSVYKYMFTFTQDDFKDMLND